MATRFELASGALDVLAERFPTEFAPALPLEHATVTYDQYGKPVDIDVPKASQLVTLSEMNR